MPKNNLTILLVALVFTGCQGHFSSYNEMMDSLHATAQPQAESVMAQINRENRFKDSVNRMLSTGQTDGAEMAINQMLGRDSLDEYFLTLKGEVFSAKSNMIPHFIIIILQ